MSALFATIPAVMSDRDAAKFRKEAKRRVLKDEDEGHMITVYQHPNGHILVDQIKLAPENRRRP